MFQFKVSQEQILEIQEKLQIAVGLAADKKRPQQQTEQLLAALNGYIETTLEEVKLTDLSRYGHFRDEIYEFLAQKVEDVSFPARVKTCFAQAGIIRVFEVVQKTEMELIHI